MYRSYIIDLFKGTPLESGNTLNYLFNLDHQQDMK